jgi:hypothetical protein
MITEIFPNFEKEPHLIQVASRTSNRLDKVEHLHSILSLNQLAQRTKNIEGCKRGIKQIIYNSKWSKITADFSTETLKSKRAWMRYFEQSKKIILALEYSIQQS